MRKLGNLSPNSSPPESSSLYMEAYNTNNRGADPNPTTPQRCLSWYLDYIVKDTKSKSSKAATENKFLPPTFQLLFHLTKESLNQFYHQFQESNPGWILPSSIPHNIHCRNMYNSPHLLHWTAQAAISELQPLLIEFSSLTDCQRLLQGTSWK